MIRTLQRRLAELERRMAGPRRRRYVWWSKGEPKPQPQAGDEELVVIRWQWGDDEAVPHRPHAGHDREAEVRGSRPGVARSASRPWPV